MARSERSDLERLFTTGRPACPPFTTYPLLATAVALTETAYQHVRLGEGGVPLIAGTTMKVIELVLARQAYGWSPEELYFQFPYLTLGQIYSALAYYADHQEALDTDIERRLERVDAIQRSTKPPPSIAALREGR